MLFPRTIITTLKSFSSDSGSEVSKLSSDDDASESDSDGGDDLFSFNLLQKDLLKELSNDQIISIIKIPLLLMFPENSSSELPTNKRNLKELQKLVVVWVNLLPDLSIKLLKIHQFVRLIHINQNNMILMMITFHLDPLDLVQIQKPTNQKDRLNNTFTNINNTDDENLPPKPLKSKVDSKDIEKTFVRPRASSNQRILMESSQTGYYNTDDENCPLRPNRTSFRA